MLREALADRFDSMPPEYPREVAGLPLEWFSSIKPNLDVNDFVEDLLGNGQMSVIYGESNSGKTFFATDLAFHVALGRQWRDREVERGAVVYIAAEGGHGIRNRVAAFRIHHGIAGNVPFAVVPSSINLLDPNAHTLPLIEVVKTAATYLGMPVRLVVIDTLSRAMAGGNENASEDMGALVMNADKIRHETGAALMFVHHSGKDAARGARGHSLLRAATDTEIEIARAEGSEIAVARVTKQREMEVRGEFAFRLEAVDLGKNRRGKSVTSCVVVTSDEVPAARTKADRLPPSAKAAFDLLLRAIAEAGEIPPASNSIPKGVRAIRKATWRAMCDAGMISDSDTPEAKQKAFKRAAEKLQSLGRIGCWGDWFWVNA